MQYIQLEFDQHIAYLRLNRPDVHNAFNDTMIAEIRDALAQVKAHAETRVLVLQSTSKHFSAGADLNWMKGMIHKNYEENIADSTDLDALMWELDRLPLPTIALVTGATFGGAVGLVACCDLVVATDRAKFCLSEVKIGLIPAVISPYVIRAIGSRQARRYMLTAEVFDGVTAEEIGLVHFLCNNDDSAHAKIQELIQTLLHNSPAAVAAAKDLVHHVSDSPIDHHIRQETAKRIADIRVSPEGQEGLGAFLEKRTAAWVLAFQEAHAGNKNETASK